MKTIGIDPGRNGAIAFVDWTDPLAPALDVRDLPPAIGELAGWLSEWSPVHVAVIEKPFAPRMVGTTHALTIGEGYGAVKAAIQLAGIRLEITTPAKWKAALSVEKDKDAAIRRASEFYPDHTAFWKRKKDHDRAEAAMLAAYARRFG